MPRLNEKLWLKREREWYFEEHIVVAETSRSWICVPTSEDRWRDSEWYIKQFGKKLPKNGKGFVTATEAEAKINNWAFSERYKISDAVERCSDPNMLLTIARMVGYKQLPEGSNG